MSTAPRSRKLARRVRNEPAPLDAGQVVLEFRRRFGTPKWGTRLEDLLFD